MSADVPSIVEAIEKVIGGGARPVHLHEPRFAGREWDYVKECIDTGWVSSAGAYVGRFERLLAERCGTEHGIAIVNGTAAIHLALDLVGVSSGDEVVIPALTFIATANAVTYCGAIPHFVDSEERSLGMDPVKLRRHLQAIGTRSNGTLVNRQTGRVIRAVMPVHVFGHPVDLNGISAVCSDFGLTMIEDATESLGSTYHNRPCGGFGRVGVLSFNGNKIVTTGGGGALVTDDAELARRAKHLSTTAKLPHNWSFLHDEIGWNYRLPNLNAALGVAQIEQLDGFLAAKRSLAARYEEAFASMRGVRFVKEPEHARSNYWLCAILLDDDSGETRDGLLQATHDAKILTRPAWTLMHRLPMYADCPRDDLATAESIERRLVNLPSSVVLGSA